MRPKGRRGRDRMVAGFTTTYAITIKVVSSNHSSSDKTDNHNITEILLKVALKTINLTCIY
jgi:predicted benzoate:H+ symporter BenE